MVFNGKLSQGCSNCRKVHVKCDGGKPECSRCVRLKKLCTGSREPRDLMFRHKSYATKQESRFGNVAKDIVPCVPSNGTSSEFAWNIFLQLNSTSADDLALAFFYTKTLENLPEEDHARDLHLSLSSLYTANTYHPALQFAALAISHEVYNRDKPNINRSNQISRKYYVQAILAINAALRDPVDVRNDQTLYAVLLLGGYETIVCDAHSLSAWGCHVDGAISLLKLRGRKCLKQPFSRKMYYFIRRSSILGNMQNAQPVESFFNNLANDQCGNESTEDLLLSKTLHIPGLQRNADILLAHDDISDELKILELISNAQNLDQSLVDWADTIASAWQYKDICSHPWRNFSASGFIPLYYHTYRNVFVGRVWNLYRVSRLIIQSIISRAISWLSKNSSVYQFPAGLATSEYIISKTVDDICSSAPFLLGFESDTQDPKMHPPSDVRWDLWPQNSMKLVNTTMNGKFSLIWPLHVASSVLLVSDDQREWIKAQLRWLGEVGNIPQASLVATRESQTLLGGAESFRFDCV